MRNSKFKIQKWAVLFCILNFSFLIHGCRFYSLEPIECTEARVAAKQFYSFHFGNDMAPTAENLRLRQRFITPEYYDTVLNPTDEPGLDYFTQSNEYPRTFKIGKCVDSSSDKATFVLQVYRRDDFSTEQREKLFGLEKRNNLGLIAGVCQKID